MEFSPRRSWKRHPLEATSPIVFSRRRRVHRARPRRRCAAEVPAPGAPIDNRWNKKLEFVYSLVTQIRAAARHPRPTLSKPIPAGRTPPTTTAADISDQHEPAFPLPTALSATTSTHHRRRTYLVTNDAVRYQHQQRAERRYQSASGSYTGRPPIPSRRHRHVDRIPAARITLFFPTFPCPRAVSFRQTSLPNYLPVLAPNAFVKR